MFLHLGTSYLAPGLMRISLFCVSVCHTAPGQSPAPSAPSGEGWGPSPAAAEVGVDHLSTSVTV